MSHWESRFFGLTPENVEDVILEPAFLLMYYMGFTYSEVHNLPVAYKKWFIERVSKELSKSSEEGATQSRAAHANTPELRQLQGRTRDQVPSRLRRFT